jgi:hypothetical protein
MRPFFLDTQRPFLYIQPTLKRVLINFLSINADDFVFGDCDGVRVIPKALAVELLLKTEEIVKRENRMRADLSKGITVSEVDKKHGKFWIERGMGLRPGRD